MHKGKSPEISIFQGFYFISEMSENVSFSMKIVVTMRSEDAQKIRILIFENLGRSQNGHTEFDKKRTSVHLENTLLSFTSAISLSSSRWAYMRRIMVVSLCPMSFAAILGFMSE